jgi:hypothetical protein
MYAKELLKNQNSYSLIVPIRKIFLLLGKSGILSYVTVILNKLKLM